MEVLNSIFGNKEAKCSFDLRWSNGLNYIEKPMQQVRDTKVFVDFSYYRIN